MKRLKKIVSTILCAAMLLGTMASSPATVSAQGQYSYQKYPQSYVSTFGWEGDKHAPIVYLEGSYQLRDNGNQMIEFGVTDVTGAKWYNAEGYLPCMVSEYQKDGVEYKIENFADEVIIDGNRFEIAYSRMTAKNTTAEEKALPVVSPGLVPLNDAAKDTSAVAAGETVVRDWCIGADRFGGSYDFPANDVLAAQGDFDTHYAHMKEYWNNRLSGIIDIKELPTGYEELINAYKAGYIYTLIVADDSELHVGENGYDQVFDHDVIGMLATLVELGDTAKFKDYAPHILMNVQYPDARWKYSWPFALYLQKTGDKEYIESVFEEIKENTHYIEAERQGPNGTMKETIAIDALGYWTIDNWAALTGLTTYKYICDSLGKTDESAWAAEQYTGLLDGINKTIEGTMEAYSIGYLPAATNKPNTLNRCVNPKDGNWAAQFMFGRWAWDGYLFGAEQSGTMLSAIDTTYTYGLDRAQAAGLPEYTFGGYAGYSSGYNAGYASAGLRGELYRDYGIKAYQWMIDNTMSGPYSWWENIFDVATDRMWDGTHVTMGSGSSPHMWGQSVNTKVLVDSLVAEKADGAVIVGRGIPKEWIQDGETVAVDNIPVAGGKRMGYTLSTAGSTVTLELTGAEVPVTLDLLALKDNIASANGLSFDGDAGTVTIPAGTRSAVITLKNSGGSALVEAKNSLEKEIQRAELADKSKFSAYTLESKAEYWAALENAKETSQKAAASLEEFSAAKTRLQSAVEGLAVYKGGSALMKDIKALGESLLRVSVASLSSAENKDALAVYIETSKALQGENGVLTEEAFAELKKRAYDAIPGLPVTAADGLYYGLDAASAALRQEAGSQADNVTYTSTVPGAASGGFVWDETLGQPVLSFPGEGAVTISGMNLEEINNDMTIEMYVKSEVTDADLPDLQTGISFMNIGNQNVVFITHPKLNITWYSVGRFSGGDQDCDMVTNDKALPNNEWMHIVMTAKDGAQTAYCNGVKMAESDASAYRFVSRDDQTITLGCPEQTLYRTGNFKMAYFRIYKGYSSADEVSAMQQNLLAGLAHEEQGLKKESLQQAIEYAEAQQAKPEYENVIPASKTVFEAALANAKNIYDNEMVSQAEVDTAFAELFDAIGYLDFYKGDKADLEKLIKAAEALDLSGYIAAGQEEFKAALAEAKKVFADENAMQDGVNDAANKLEIAMANLVAKGNKHLLKQAIDLAEGLDLTKYVDKGKAELAIALREAKKVYDKEEATQEEIDKARIELNAALFNLRKKADKENLAAVIAKAEALSPKDYTPESFADVAQALSIAAAMMDDNTLSEKDQAKVDAAEAVLAAAIENLVKASTDTPDTPDNPGDKEEPGGSSAPNGDGPKGGGETDEPKGDNTQTGDAAPLAGLSLLTAACGAALILCRKKNR